MSDTFTCDHCKGTFEKGWSDEEADAEAASLWGAVPREQLAVICDDCHKRFMCWMRGRTPEVTS